MVSTFQIVYTNNPENIDEIHPYFKDEAKAMTEIGIVVDTKPLFESKSLMYRGTTIITKDKYPKDRRYIHSPEINYNYLYLSAYYPLISDLSIETYFFDQLDYRVVELMRKKGWERAFIKKDYRALENIEKDKSVYPNTSFDEMIKLYDEMGVVGNFAIRKYIDKSDLFFDNELRYWVLNGKIYRKDNVIPNIVKEAVKRLNKLGGRYYTIDATPEFIIEVNPGESSDRHAENSPKLFANWIKEAFA